MDEKELEDRIVNAIKAKNAKKLLQQRENRILRSTKRRKMAFIRIFSGLAAACIAVCVIHFNGISTYRSYGNQYYAAMEISVSRGSSDVDSLLQVAYGQIGVEDYDSAHKNIDAAIALLQSEEFDLSTEEGQYFSEINKQTMDDAEWLSVVAYMKQGKRHKAKSLLKRIAEGDGIHKNDALEILK